MEGMGKDGRHGYAVNRKVTTSN